MEEKIIRLIIVALLVFIINIPFGKLRANTKKFSFKWFLYIHLPIPFIVLLRYISEIGFAFYTYPVLIAAFFFGQRVGSKIGPTIFSQSGK